ncbi:MAG TPA: FtsX-like permease family protein [Candidatus Dormibacteraeota bacterium]
MMLALLWLRGVLARRRARFLGASAGVAVAVALLAAVGPFIAAAEASMTARSIARVGVDWQVQAQPGADASAVLRQVQGYPRARAALPVAFAQTDGFQASSGGATRTTGAGVVVGLPPGYEATFPAEVRRLAGGGGGVLLAQQTAANLHAAPGDTIAVGRAPLPPVSMRVDAIVALPDADALFRRVGAPAQSQPTAPPDNVLLLPAASWHEAFDPLAAARPDRVAAQVHVRLAHDLPADPVSAYTDVTGGARNLEARLAGAGLVGDNLAATLDAARSDALYAQLLFVFLALPGAVVAALLTASVARSGGDRRRGEQALLRARGASASQLLGLALVEALAAGLLGSAVGLAAAWLIGRLAFGSGSFGPTPTAAAVWVSAASAAGLAIAAGTLLVPAWRDACRLTVTGARRQVWRVRPPGWGRYVVDAALLGSAGVVFWFARQTGFALLLVPEGVPQVSVSAWPLLGPVLLWAGFGLLAWHAAADLLARGRGPLAWLLRPAVRGLAVTVASWVGRQRGPIAAAVALVALSAGFAISTAVFNATYRQQAAVDATLTNGADVRVAEPPGAAVPPGARARLRAVEGVRSVEPLQHRFAYVGADLQDLYGIRAASVVDGARLQDAYVDGGSASAVFARLAREPDGILVSAETVRDFQLQAGDRITLRLQDQRTGAYGPVTFHYVGVVREFPTAPKDSFLVANAAYVASATGSAAVDSFLVTTDGAPPDVVAQRIRSVVGPGVQVTSASGVAAAGTSLTAVDLAGLTRVELAFALVLAAAASGLVLALGLIERRRMFAIASAVGARPGQLAAIVWTEVALVIGGGLVAGALGGWALSAMLVAVLTGVFDPPPAALAVPWGYLSLVALLAIASTVAAALAGLRMVRRAPLEVLRDL